MKLINVVGDSLSMPRVEDGISGMDLYWLLLQERLGPSYYVIHHSKRRTDSSEIRRDLADLITGYPAHALILHTGIVDCFPRLFSRREHAVLSGLQRIGLGFITRFITGYAGRHRYQWTKNRPRVYVPLPQYRENIWAIIDSALRSQTQHVLLLAILDTNDDLRQRTYNVDAQIRVYNNVLRELAADSQHIHYLDLNAYFQARGIMPVLSDGHHLTREAHIHIAEILATCIRNLDA
jgi:hypothetical protein